MSGVREGKRNHGLFGLAMRERAGADHEGAFFHCFCERCGFAGTLEKLWGSDCGAGFAPVRGIGGCNGKVFKAKVRHGASNRSDIEWIARGNKDDADVVELILEQQESIVERDRAYD